MLVKKIIYLFLCIELLSGCANQSLQEMNKHPPDYAKAKSVTPAQIPADLSGGNMVNYFPIPPVATDQAPLVPSVLPPGSVMAQRQAQKNAAMAATTISSQKSAVIASSSNALMLSLDSDQAWTAVGKALRASGYKIAQQDKGLGTYYILGIEKGDRLQVNTPIYQVNVKTVNNNSRISIYDDKNHIIDSGVSARILGKIQKNI